MNQSVSELLILTVHDNLSYNDCTALINLSFMPMDISQRQSLFTVANAFWRLRNTQTYLYFLFFYCLLQYIASINVIKTASNFPEACLTIVENIIMF